MRSTILFVVVCVSVTLLGRVNGESCGSLECGEDEACCMMNSNYRCYNSSQYSCLEASGGNILCGYINGDWYPAKACGDICYDGQFYDCCNNQIYDKQNLRANPCLTPVNSDQEGCFPSCVQPTKCCNDTINGPVCFNAQTHICVDNSLVCPLEDGVPNLACGTACYNPKNYGCCGTQLFSKGELNNPCISEEREITLSANSETEILFTSTGFQAPPYGLTSTCNWNAQDAESSGDTYELYSCTSVAGWGAFSYNESYYLMTFALPANLAAYGSDSTLSVFVDNSQGMTQELVVSVFNNALQGTINASGSAPERSCEGLKVFTPPLFAVNTTVQEGYVGYVYVDINPLLTWFSATQNENGHDLQLSISAARVCACLESGGKCIYTLTCDCQSPSYHLKISGNGSSSAPKIFLR